MRSFDRFGDAKLVLPGEATHGTAEFYRARAAITRRLIEKHGFNIVAVEADWPDAARIDRYVRHRAHEAAAAEAVARFPTSMWRNQEMHDFTEWLRMHNEGLPTEDRVQRDPPFPRGGPWPATVASPPTGSPLICAARKTAGKIHNAREGLMPFHDRHEAGQLLAKALSGYRRQRPVILALPRGGVPVAGPVARALGAPLELLIVRKIGLPSQPELAMGAVADGINPLVVRNENVIRMAGVSEADFAEVRDAELAEIDRRRGLYVAHRPFPLLKGRTVIVIDDGIATGATIKAALQSVRKQTPRRLVLAVPVAAADTLADLRSQADAIVCLEAPAALGAIGAFYAVFDQVSDAEVIETLASFWG